MPIPLHQLKRNQPATIEKISCDAEDRELIAGLGIQVGEQVELLRMAPFGGPLQLRVEGVCFALAREIAKGIEVSPSAKGA